MNRPRWTRRRSSLKQQQFLDKKIGYRTASKTSTLSVAKSNLLHSLVRLHFPDLCHHGSGQRGVHAGIGQKRKDDLAWAINDTARALPTMARETGDLFLMLAGLEQFAQCKTASLLMREQIQSAFQQKDFSLPLCTLTMSALTPPLPISSRT